ncbi:protocadherin gamma-C5-like [Pelobates fuscus]|uniref:protocadherin gamma-C5-like n=1 Tax=Pelobates fuscus TaxID=191477 RepID=UPI002FE4BFD6
MDFRRSEKAWKWQVIFSLFIFSWGWVSGQLLRYSVQEESDPGTLVGNLANELRLNLADISKRRLHLRSELSNSHFVVNQGSGALTVKERIDRESLCGSSDSCILLLKLIAENPSELFSIEIEILDINDNSPTFPNAQYILKITEVFTSPGIRFSLESAQDPDVGINSISQYILNSNPFFSLSVKNRKDGTLIPQIILNMALDREDISEHTLILTAIDGGEPARSGSCKIRVIVLDVNDNAPVFDQASYKIHVQENLPLKTVIIKLNATDLDENINGEIEYFFDDHTAATVKDLFDLNPHTGDIYLKGALDFEVSNFYEISIVAKDKGLPSLVGHCLIQVEIIDENDNHPELIFTSILKEVPENSSLGTTVGFLSVKDKDSGKNGEVQLEIYPNIPFEVKLFQTHYTLVTNRHLDRENTSRYSIQIIATDLGSPAMITQITINLSISDINDNAPVFMQSVYQSFIKENNDAGSLLCTVSAYDPDEGVNAEFKFSLVETELDTTSASSLVYINPSNGNIYAQRSYDYEQIQLLQITVRVQDSGSPTLSSDTDVFIFLLDENDNYPTVLYLENSGAHFSQGILPKYSSEGYLVTKISAVDLDSGYNAWLRFTLTEPSESPLFSVSQYTGEVRSIRRVSELDNPEQQLIISVTDHGIPSLTSTVTIFIDIVDITLQDNPKTHNFVANAKPSSDLTLYLVISLVSISLVSLITFIILLVKCFRKDEHDSSCSNCFLYKAQSKCNMEQYQPTLYLNTDGTLKYMEVRMAPPEPQGHCYQTCFPQETKTHDLCSIEPLQLNQVQEISAEIEPSVDPSCAYEPRQDADSSLFQVSSNTEEIRTIRPLKEADNIEQHLVVLIKDHGNPTLSTTVTILVNILDSILQENAKSRELLPNSKPTSDLALSDNFPCGH